MQAYICPAAITEIGIGPIPVAAPVVDFRVAHQAHFAIAVAAACWSRDWIFDAFKCAATDVRQRSGRSNALGGVSPRIDWHGG